MKEYLVKSKDHSRFFKASSAEVAAKRFLNYLRRYTKDRPIEITIVEKKRSGLCVVERTEIVWSVEWYVGQKQDGVFLGVQGEWYRLKGRRCV
jgi:hypothetical protein